MAVSRVIEVSFRGSSVALVRVDTAYFYNNGILFKPVDLDLPTSYQVHWSDSPQSSSTLETIGTSEGAPIPDDLWDRSRVIYGWIYLHPTVDSGVTAYEVRIYKNVRAGLPDGTEPTPAEQSTIDQLIGALNSAVEQTGQDVESASQTAQSAESAKTVAESARDTAQGYANNASASATSAQTSASQASASALSASNSALSSSEYASNALGYAESASESAQASAQSATASANSATSAQGYAQSASASAQSASGYASNAQTSANTASAKAQEASTSAQTASTKATEASQSATNASQSAQTAEQAKTASQTAQGLVESARDTAVSAKNDAESARDDAESARDEAQQAVASISGALNDKAPVITDTASGSIASFNDGADNLPLKSLIVDINPIQDLSHGDPSPENICPISGWTEIGVEQRGKNIAIPKAYPMRMSTSIPYIRDMTEIISPFTTPFTWCGVGFTAYVKKGVTYTLSSDATGTQNMIIYGVYPDIESAIDRSNVLEYGVANISVTPNHDGLLVFMRYNQNEGTVVTWTYGQCELGSTATPYEPHTGRSLTIDLGQTVYGGKLDVLSGELTVYPYYASYNGETLTGEWISDRDKYVAGATPTIGAQVVNIGAQGVTVQLSANQLNSLYGVNNLWADSGDCTAEYRADTKLFIERLTAPDSADMVADANIQSGKYFMVGNNLFKATANIANGSAIIVGTNAVRKSLSEALNEINA